MAKPNEEIHQTVEKFKYKDTNKAFHKMAISLRSIACGEPIVGLLTVETSNYATVEHLGDRSWQIAFPMMCF